MTAYSQLSDAELVRKVQELMGYEVVTARRNATAGCFLRRNKKIVHFGQTDIEAWSHAPNPLTDANVCMALVDEMWDEIPKERRGDFILVRDAETGKWYCEAPIEHSVEWSECDKRERAICEVYCAVKEGKG